jgi:hypothetical protein
MNVVTCPFPLPLEFPATLLRVMPNDGPDDASTETIAIPDPPPGTAMETARRAWQVAWGASNAVAGYHASVIHHIVDLENRMVREVGALRTDVEKQIRKEIGSLKDEVTRDFMKFRHSLVSALGSVGIHINLTPSGEHAIAQLTQGQPIVRERVASSHDLEEGFAEVGEQIEERFSKLTHDLRVGAPVLQSVPSDRVKELLTQERASIEADQKIMRLELEASQRELAHAQELKRIGDQRQDLVESNARWLRIAFMVAGGVVTVLGGLLIWALTKSPPSLGG